MTKTALWYEGQVGEGRETQVATCSEMVIMWKGRLTEKRAPHRHTAKWMGEKRRKKHCDGDIMVTRISLERTGSMQPLNTKIKGKRNNEEYSLREHCFYIYAIYC